MSFKVARPIVDSQEVERLRDENAALRASLQSAQALIKIAPAFFGYVSPDGVILDLNDLALQVIGTPRNQVIGRLFWESPWWQPLPASAERIRNAVVDGAKGNPSRFDIEYWAVLDGIGQKRWVELTVTPFRDESDSVTQLAVAGIDITERKQAAQEVERSRQELHDFFMQAPVPMVIVSGPKHLFTLANPLYEKFVGRSVVGKTVLEAFTQEEVAHFIPLLDGVYQTGIPYVGKEIPLHIPDENGTIQNHWVNLGYHPFRDALGEVKGILAVLQDVTELVGARMKAEAGEAHFRQIANAMPQIIWTATPDGFVDWYNDWWYKYTGYPHGTHWDDPEKQPMHPEDVARTWPVWKESLTTGKAYEIEQRFKQGSDGQYRWHRVRGLPVRDSEGRIVKWVGGNMDVHDQKMSVQTLEEERLLREQFVATLTHDLRTPLTAARMRAQMMVRRVSDPAVFHKAAARIVENIDRADQMIRDLLDSNRIKAGEKLPIDVTQFEAKDIIETTVEELSSIHGDRFTVNVPESLQVYWSRDGIRRILENLCNNAVKYGSRDRRVSVSVEPKQTQVEIRIHNHGQSISAADQKSLFDPFRRVALAQLNDEKGWGLGLTLVRGIAEAHGGTVSVESSPEKGTTFVVTLPTDSRSAQF